MPPDSLLAGLSGPVTLRVAATARGPAREVVRQVPPPALAVLPNQFTNSDGDQFPYFFRCYGLGTVVGSRTEGGVRGIQARRPLLDGATVTAPKDVRCSGPTASGLSRTSAQLLI